MNGRVCIKKHHIQARDSVPGLGVRKSKLPGSRTVDAERLAVKFSDAKLIPLAGDFFKLKSTGVLLRL